MSLMMEREIRRVLGFLSLWNFKFATHKLVVWVDGLSLYFYLRTVSASRVVVATVYAPNCHRESKLMFQDFLFNLDLITERLSEQSHEFNVVVTGDLNVVLDPDNGQLNRIGSPRERCLTLWQIDCLRRSKLVTHNATSSLGGEGTVGPSWIICLPLHC